MPNISDETPRDNITIAGKTFSVPQPYTEGHTLSAGEANALNQTYAENLRNNFSKKVKDASDTGSFDQDVFQSTLDEYAEEYEFGERVGGQRGDPVMNEAMEIMRDKVRKAIVKSGQKLKDFKPKAISERAKAEFTKNSPAAQQVMALAKQRVEAAQEVADVELAA